jgi:hypothetical protein
LQLRNTRRQALLSVSESRTCFTHTPETVNCKIYECSSLCNRSKITFFHIYTTVKDRYVRYRQRAWGETQRCNDVMKPFFSKIIFHV